jgi:hypothetical protein
LTSLRRRLHQPAPICRFASGGRRWPGGVPIAGAGRGPAFPAYQRLASVPIADGDGDAMLAACVVLSGLLALNRA